MQAPVSSVLAPEATADSTVKVTETLGFCPHCSVF